MSATDARQDDSVSSDSAEPLGLDFAGRLRGFAHGQRWTFVSFAAHGVMLWCLALMPPRSSALALDMLTDDGRQARYLATPLARDPQPLYDIGWLRREDAGAQAPGSGQAGSTGRPQEPSVRRGAAPSRAASPARDLRTDMQQRGVLGILAQAQIGFDVRGPYAAAAIADYGPAQALGALVAAQLGDGHGFLGLTMRGSGRSGGGDARGTIGVGALSTGQETGTGPGVSGTLPALRREAHVPRISPEGAADVRGGLSKETIRRVIQRHLNEVRFCYEQALRSRPELGGRVQVGFMIAPSGAVVQTQVNESTLGSREAEQCIASAVLRWTFPAPDGGGYVTVRYPFLLEPAGA